MVPINNKWRYVTLIVVHRRIILWTSLSLSLPSHVRSFSAEYSGHHRDVCHSGLDSTSRPVWELPHHLHQPGTKILILKHCRCDFQPLFSVRFKSFASRLFTLMWWKHSASSLSVKHFQFKWMCHCTKIVCRFCSSNTPLNQEGISSLEIGDDMRQRSPAGLKPETQIEFWMPFQLDLTLSFYHYKFLCVFKDSPTLVLTLLYNITDTQDCICSNIQWKLT